VEGLWLRGWEVGLAVLVAALAFMPASAASAGGKKGKKAKPAKKGKGRRRGLPKED
jgi:hypothetical protein